LQLMFRGIRKGTSASDTIDETDGDGDGALGSRKPSPNRDDDQEKKVSRGFDF